MKNYNDTTELVDEMMNHELGVLLSGGNTFLKYMAGNNPDQEKRCGIFADGNKKVITVEVWPLLYNEDICKMDSGKQKSLVRYRMLAVNNIFKRWSAAGHNKHHAKNPFNCKAFQRYLDEIDFNNADYLIIRA